MGQRDEHPSGLRQQGVLTVAISIVFLLLSALFWRVGGAIALGAAIIFLAWGLHGVLRGVLFLGQSRKLEDEE